MRKQNIQHNFLHSFFHYFAYELFLINGNKHHLERLGQKLQVLVFFFHFSNKLESGRVLIIIAKTT